VSLVVPCVQTDGLKDRRDEVSFRNFVNVSKKNRRVVLLNFNFVSTEQLHIHRLYFYVESRGKGKSRYNKKKQANWIGYICIRTTI
jgi:hypothetical protein